MLSSPVDPGEGSPGETRSKVCAQRYMAFLLSTLPRLAAQRLYSPRWPFAARRAAVLDRALAAFAGRPGIALEFGVYHGNSLRRAAGKYPRRRFYGFDSFAGLPPDGRPDWQIDFAVGAIPSVPANCRLIRGWFADTIPEFLRRNDEPIGFVNIDCDIYSSARTVLFGLRERLRPGAILYFDELINYDTFLWNEMLALFEFLDATGFGVEWLACHRAVRGVEEVFAELESGRYPPWKADVAAGYHRPAAALLTAHNDDPDRPLSRDTERRVAELGEKFTRFTERYEAMRPPGVFAEGAGQ